MNNTNATAAALINQAITARGTITVPCPNGDTITASAGKVLRWGRSSQAAPSGREIPGAWSRDVGLLVVQQCGRGNAAKAARAILEAA